MRLLLLISIILTIEAQWNPYNFGNYGGNGYPAPVPNNNLAIGYPTAYGLWAGRANNNNNNWNYWNGDQQPMPNQGTGFGSPLKCLNGGAHIGQCRLDKDSICIALGGICVHGACCTTPFSGVMLVSTSPKPSVEGDTLIGKTRTFAPYTTTSESPTVTMEKEHNSHEELDELTRLIEEAKTMRPVIVAVTEPPRSAEDDSYEIANEKRCQSGLRPIGPCTDDQDCPALHRCEIDKCCYIVGETQRHLNANYYNHTNYRTNYPGFHNYQPY